MEVVNVSVVGHKYRKQYNYFDMVRATEYKIEPEPENKYDSNALACYYKQNYGYHKWIHFGYVPRRENQDERLLNMLKKNHYMEYRRYNYNKYVNNVLFFKLVEG